MIWFTYHRRLAERVGNCRLVVARAPDGLHCQHQVMLFSTVPLQHASKKLATAWEGESVSDTADAEHGSEVDGAGRVCCSAPRGAGRDRRRGRVVGGRADLSGAALDWRRVEVFSRRRGRLHHGRQDVVSPARPADCHRAACRHRGALIGARTRHPQRDGLHLGHRWTGATGPTGNRYGDAPGHACVGVVGPGVSREERADTIETGHGDRPTNMETFAWAALNLLNDMLGPSKA